MLPSPANFNFYKNDRNSKNIGTSPSLISKLVVGATYNLDENILDQEGKKFEISKQSGKKDPNAPYKHVSVIVYRDGILFAGESNGISSKIQSIFSKIQGKNGEKEWKQLLFKNIKHILALEDALNITMKDDYTCNFKPEIKSNYSKNMKTWNEFLCFVDSKLAVFYDIKNTLEGHRKLCTAKLGGRRKTKRSKRSKHTRRNKKCKRRTRRS